MSTTMIRVLLDWSKAAVAELLARANAVYAGMNLNPAYPNPPIPMSELRLAIDNLSAAITAALDGGSKAIAHRIAMAEALRQVMRTLAHYVEGSCNGDMEVFLSSGFQAVGIARARSHPVSKSIRSLASGVSGEILVAPVAVPGAVSYEVRWAAVTSGGSPGEWASRPIPQIRPPASIGGLTPGTSYAFQVRALTKSGLTDWSDAVTRICI